MIWMIWMGVFDESLSGVNTEGQYKSHKYWIRCVCWKENRYQSFVNESDIKL